MGNAVKTFFSSLLIVFATLFAAPAFAALPTGYTELEYIESTGTQYIDTGYTMTSDIVEYGVEVYGTPNSNTALFGSETSNTPKYSGIPYRNNSGVGLYIGSTPGILQKTFPSTQWNIYVIKTTSATAVSVTLNGATVSATYSGGIQKEKSIYVFDNNQTLNSEKTSVKMKSFYIKDNNVLVRNLVPAKNSSGVIGMYDTVNNRFYTNQGTGEFTAGPVVGIRIATTAYNTARFSPVVTDLNSTIATIRNVVTNTINQTAAIADLQATKQTRPDAECPKFRQCLLVEDNNNIPHWYLIKDPVRDLVKSLRDNKINSAGATTTTAYAANGYDGTNGTTDSRYYNGYVAMRKLADGSTSVNNRQFGASLTGGDNGGQYKTLVPQEWAITWDGNETGTANSFLPGVIYGTSRCAKTKPSSTAVGTDGWTTIENSDPVNDAENIQSYVQCYCKMTGVGVDGEFTPVRDSSRAPWVFFRTYDSAADCAAYCAYRCAVSVRDDASFRQRIMDWAVE